MAFYTHRVPVRTSVETLWALLVDKIRKGGSGVFGPIPMSPNGPDKIDDADLKAAVEFILKS